MTTRQPPHTATADTRHTYATALINSGVSLQALMALLGHVSAEMSLRYGRLFDQTVRADYEKALTLAKSRLGPVLPERAPLPIVEVTGGSTDWRQAPLLKARLSGGYCLRTAAQGSRAYANICEHCPELPHRHRIPAYPGHPTRRCPSAGRRCRSPRLGRGSGSPPPPHQTPRSSDEQDRTVVTDQIAIRVERACQDLLAADCEVTFPAIAARTGIGKATLYRRPELRTLIEEHRQRGRDALTLTGLEVQIDQLRAALEAVATKVRRHEEDLRRLKHARRSD
ncbi:tyrosine-type recombinase/integrase [Nonomuraea sp. M3C6]|uniref:Tyrosine-type recombinase/integrase n=1 Tax=Nonomuraea marmarensis TaxID=3351344 RepID=A0ABW7ATF3_9ACTN